MRRSSFWLFLSALIVFTSWTLPAEGALYSTPDITTTAVRAVVEAIFKTPEMQKKITNGIYWTKESIDNLVGFISKSLAAAGIADSDGRVKDEIRKTLDSLPVKQSTNYTQYDLIIDASSLLGLREGWVITEKEGVSTQTQGLVVGLIGGFDAGKTFIINEIEDIGLPSGVTSVTPALGSYQSKKFPSVIFQDSQGSDRPVSSSAVDIPTTTEDRLATDEFIRDVVIALSNVLVYVTGPLRSNQVPLISKIHSKSLSYAAPHSERKMIVVHNWQDYAEEEEVQKHINDDILQPFGITQSELVDSESQCVRWIKNGIVHVVMARKGTPAGDKYNACALKTISNIIRGVTHRSEIAPLEEVKRIAEEMLPDYFYPPEHNRELPPNSNVFQFLKRHAAMASYSIKRWLKGDDNNNNLNTVFKLEFVTEEDKKLLRLQNNKEPLHYLPMGEHGVPDAKFVPSYDLFEDGEDAWLLLMDLPGLVEPPKCTCNKKNRGIIFISGTRELPEYKLPHLKNSPPFTRKYGSFGITITLPHFLICDDAIKNYKYSNGVLKLRFEQEGYTPPATATKNEL